MARGRRRRPRAADGGSPCAEGTGARWWSAGSPSPAGRRGPPRCTLGRAAARTRSPRLLGTDLSPYALPGLLAVRRTERRAPRGCRTLTYRIAAGRMEWESPLGGRFRLHENRRGYRFGHRMRGGAWASAEFTRVISGYLQVEHLHWGDISGADAALNPPVVPTADPALRAGSRTDVVVGFALDGNQRLEGLRLEFSARLPVQQRLDGPQLSRAGAPEIAVEYVIGTREGAE